MKLIEYVRSNLLQIMCQFLLILIVNAVLVTSNSLDKSIKDIIYLDILLGLVLVAFHFYGYIHLKNMYGNLRKALEQGRNIDYLLPDDESLQSKIL